MTSLRRCATDAVLLISLLRNSDRVTAACQAQLVNVIAPIRTEPGGPAWRQTIFHPFALTARLAKGEVLRVEPHGPSHETARYGDVPTVDAVATHDPATGDVALFMVNRDQARQARLTVDLRAFGAEMRVAEAWTVTDKDLDARNTAREPDRVRQRPLGEGGLGEVSVDGAVVSVCLPRVSWAALRLRRADAA